MTLTSGQVHEDFRIDARRAARLPVRRAVRVYEPYAGRQFPAVTRNVSEEGICLDVVGPTTLRPGRFVTVHDMPAAGPVSAGSARQEITARVVWVRPAGSNPAVCRVGLELFARPLAVAA